MSCRKSGRAALSRKAAFGEQKIGPRDQLRLKPCKCEAWHRVSKKQTASSGQACSKESKATGSPSKSILVKREAWHFGTSSLSRYHMA